MFLYWFKFLQEAEKSDEYQVDWSKYKGWGSANYILGSKFDDFCEGIVNGDHPWVGHKDTDSFLKHWLSENAPGIELGKDEELSRVLRMALNEARIGRLARNYPASDGSVWQNPEEA